MAWPVLSFEGVSGGFLLGFPSLFSIVNPLGSSLIFSQVLADRTPAERAVLARLVGFYSCIVLLVSLWAGAQILHFFGVSIAALRIAGGLVVASRAWLMLNAPQNHEDHKAAQANPARDKARPPASDSAFYPLTMPFTTGPGTISVAVALASAGPSAGVGWLPFLAGMSAAALCVAGIVWVAYRFADLVLRVLGPSGARVVSRMVAFLLLCIGTQIMLTGVQDVLK
jgi:multiple antibiotic resistance protein